MEEELEYTWEEWIREYPEGGLVADIRDEGSIAYGMIPGSVWIDGVKLLERRGELEGAKAVLLCCARGEESLVRARELRAAGVRAYSLKGGYIGWMIWKMRREEEEETGRDKHREVEESIRGTYHKRLFSKFARAVRDYRLISEGDKIAVCISGGKDSTLMAKLFQELQRHRKMHFELTFLVMDPGYSEANRKLIEHNARMLGIPVTIFDTPIFDIVYETDRSPCYLCARMRRGYLYSRAKELGCNKIALGHHYDDVIETILMGMLYGGQVQTMMPKLHSIHFEGMELIRPMYLIREDDIKRWRDTNGLHFLQCACHFTDTCTTCDAQGRSVSKRMEVKKLIARLKEGNPFIEGNIFKSVENVNLDTVIGYKKGGVRHSFLEEYDGADPEK